MLKNKNYNHNFLIIFTQMMSANGPVLQFIQPNSRNNVNNIQVKSKPPPQILPKPIGSNNHVQNHASINSLKSQQSHHHSTSIHSQQQGAFLINQVSLLIFFISFIVLYLVVTISTY